MNNASLGNVRRFALGWLAAGALAATSIAQGGNLPIAHTAQPEVSINVAWDGMRFLVATQGDSSGLSAAGAVFVDPSGVVGPSVVTGSYGGAPLVAFDGSQYLMTWDDESTWPNNNVYAMFVQPDGSHVAPFPVAVDAWPKYATGIACGAGQFLIVYARANSLLARLVSPSAIVGPELTISSSFFAGLSARNVAANGSTFLVAWVDDALRNEVRARTLDASGVLGPEFTIDASPAPSNDVLSVAANNNGFLVAYPDEVGGAGSGEWDLYVQAFSMSGTPIGSPQVACSAAGWQFAPFLASNGNEYLLTWTDLRNDANKNWQCELGESTCWDIWGCYRASDGSALGEAWPIVERAGDQFASPVAAGAGKYLMAWTDGTLASTGGDVYASLLPQAPVAHVYCTAKVNSQGCTPSIAFAGIPSVSGAAPFTLRALSELNQETGTFFYSLGGPGSAPFRGGYLCEAGRLWRTPMQSSGGNPPPSDCSGTYAFDFNAWVRNGVDARLFAGQFVWGQFWAHDAAGTFHASLTSAVEFAIGP